MRFWPARAAFVIGAALAAPLSAQEGAPGWDVSLRGSFGRPSGSVQVRENALEGTPLELRGDLGVTTSESIGLRLAHRAASGSELSLSLESLFVYGSTRLPSDVLFNGATLEGGTELRTRPEWYRVSAAYSRRLVSFAGGGSLTAEAGLAFVLLTFKLDGTLSPATKGTETKEDFVTQELPVPTLGLRLERPLSRRLTFTASASAGLLPLVDSLRNEGGVVKISQHDVGLSLGLATSLGGLRVEAGYRFGDFAQHEVSREDDNDVRLREHAVFVSLGRFF